MADLALSILFSSLIFVVFKLFAVYRVETLYGIIVNYMTAAVVGLIFYQERVDYLALYSKPWFTGTVFLGALFIVVFNLIAKTSQQLGVSVASVATKMSLVIPVIFGISLYGEALGPVKIIGVILALAAVYLSSIKKSTQIVRSSSLILPLLVFLGSGIIDASIKFMEETQVVETEFPLFSATVFASAAFFGLIFILLRHRKFPFRLHYRNLLGGLALGIPNFFSIYFILRALRNNALNSASVFTINNVAIVMFSTLLGILLFRERLSTMNWIGIGMAVISIFLTALF